METKIYTKFSINNYVYHNTPDSPKGIIIDINYSLLNKQVKYFVCFGWESNSAVWCNENEISENKTF